MMSIQSEDDWRIDVENTRLELGAYESLANAYGVLANLPENSGNSMHRLKSARFRDTHAQCADYLAELVGFGKNSDYSIADFDFTQPSGCIGGEW